MGLPTINHPIFRTKIPSTGEEIRFRSFLVKEEKILVTAIQSDDPQLMVDSLIQIINNCLVTEGINVSKLASFDVEWIFLNLRLKSVSDVVELTRICSSCENQFPFEFNLADVEIPVVKNIENKIQLTDEIGVILKYPSLNTMIIGAADQNIDSIFSMIGSCIDQIYDNDKVYDSKEYSSQEIVDWMLELPGDSFLKVENFFDSIPSLSHEFDVKCTHCSDINHIALSGLNDFLD